MPTAQAAIAIPGMRLALAISGAPYIEYPKGARHRGRLLCRVPIGILKVLDSFNQLLDADRTGGNRDSWHALGIGDQRRAVHRVSERRAPSRPPSMPSPHRYPQSP